MLYRFQDKQIIAHVLAYFPSPDLESFQNDPEYYQSDEIIADVNIQNIVPIPLRFDFDGRKDIVADVDHARSHSITLNIWSVQKLSNPCKCAFNSLSLYPIYFEEFLRYEKS